MIFIVPGILKMSSENNIGKNNYTDIIEVKKQNLLNYVSVSGNVEGINVFKVTSTLNSRIQKLNVNIGDKVNEGDELCVFDNTELLEQYNNLKNVIEVNNKINNKNHDANVTALENAKIEKENALLQAQRGIDDSIKARDNAYSKYNTLKSKYSDACKMRDNLSGSISDENSSEYDEYANIAEELGIQLELLEEQLSSYDNAVRDAKELYASTERNMNNAIQAAQNVIDMESLNIDNDYENELKKINKMLDQCVVKAPKSGVITSLNVAEGSFPTGDSIMTIEDTSSFKIVVNVKEADILNVREGMKAIITTAATGSKEIVGKVSRVINIVSQPDLAGEGQGGYTAEIIVENNDSGLLIGMNAKAKLILDEKNDVLSVPYDSILEDEEGNNYVYVAEKNTNDNGYTAKKITVSKGIETAYFTEISSNNIKENDFVILNPSNISDGDTVKINVTESVNGGE